MVSPDLHLKEIVDEVHEITGVSVDLSTIYRLLTQHGLTRGQWSLEVPLWPVCTPFQLRCLYGSMSPDQILRTKSGDMARLYKEKGLSVKSC